jgi:hypothetical protein
MLETITHPTTGTTAPIAWTVGTNAGDVAGVKDRFGWCFYLLPEKELIGLVFTAGGCSRAVRHIHAGPWNRPIEKCTRLTSTALAFIAMEVGNKHAEQRASGEWALYCIERMARQRGIDLEMEGQTDG